MKTCQKGENFLVSSRWTSLCPETNVCVAFGNGVLTTSFDGQPKATAIASVGVGVFGDCLTNDL